MKPVRVVTLCWALLLVSGLGAARKESPEEASFYYGNFPLGMSTLQLLCPSVHLSVSLPTLADLSEFRCFSFLIGRMVKITPCSCSEIKVPNRFLKFLLECSCFSVLC